METGRDLVVNLTVEHFEEEGAWCLPTECHVGEDDD